MSFNKVILMGRLSKEPDRRVTADGKDVVRFSIAVDRRYQKEGEERKADFFNCVAFGNTAKFIGDYFDKGHMIHICGNIQNRRWTDDNEVRRIITEIFVEEANFCGSKKEAGSGKTENEKEDFIPIDEDDNLPF